MAAQTETPAFTSYVALGDSFTEGLNDPDPDGGFAGWADRLARLLAEGRPRTAGGPYDFRYANLAVRGRLLDQIVDEQVPRIDQMHPDLVSFTAGGNDILRPGSDPDEVAERFEAAAVRLRESAGTVLICTGFDTRDTPVLKHLRGKIATYTALFTPINTRLLGAGGYGRVTIALSVMMIVFSFASLSVASAVQKVFADDGGPEKARRRLAAR